MSDEAKALYPLLLSLVDLTSLESTDNEKTIRELCRKALRCGESGLPMPAAVCLYSPWISIARQELQGSGIRIATVAGGFPHGQVPFASTVAEIRSALDQQADEIDLVFARGLFLAGETSKVSDQIAKVREITTPLTLKVILETGELVDPGLIAQASGLAIRAGADFIKTSTGKIQVGATPEAVSVMLEQIRIWSETTGKPVGIKPSGGISTPETALIYYRLVESILGPAWLTKERFRLGASKLVERLVDGCRK